MQLTRREAAVDLVLTILLVPFSAIGAGVVVGFLSGGMPNLTVVVLVQALLVLAGISLVLERRGQRFRHIGLRGPQARDVARALLVLAAGFGVNLALTVGVVALSPDTLQEHIAGLESVAVDLTDDTPLAAVLALLLLVGIYEEIVARGVLLTRARELLGGTAGPVLLSSALFAIGHYYQGVYGVIQTALFGIVLALFTVRWGTLWPAIIAHAAINMLSVVQLDRLGVPA